MTKCVVCGEPIFSSRKGVKYCNQNCTQKAYDRKRAASTKKSESDDAVNHDASKVVKEFNLNNWDKATILAEEYKKDIQFIQRSLEACRLAEVPESYFIDRYLKGDKSIPLNEEVNVISLKLQKEVYRQR